MEKFFEVPVLCILLVIENGEAFVCKIPVLSFDWCDL